MKRRFRDAEQGLFVEAARCQGGPDGRGIDDRAGGGASGACGATRTSSRRRHDVLLLPVVGSVGRFTVFLHEIAEFIDFQLQSLWPKAAKFAVEELSFLPAAVGEAVSRVVASRSLAVHVGAGDIFSYFRRFGMVILRPKLGQTFANLSLAEVQLCTQSP